MKDEKKLDEKQLEKVIGGIGIADEWTYEEWAFICNNCLCCRHEGPGTCPYGTDKHAAIRQAGMGATCPQQMLVTE